MSRPFFQYGDLTQTDWDSLTIAPNPIESVWFQLDQDHSIQAVARSRDPLASSHKSHRIASQSVQPKTVCERGAMAQADLSQDHMRRHPGLWIYCNPDMPMPDCQDWMCRDA